MIVYISGAITGQPDYMDKFNAAEERLKQKGYEVVNPAKLGEQLKVFPYGTILALDIAVLLNCNAIYMLKGWEDSKGANSELEFAATTGKTVIYEGD